MLPQIDKYANIQIGGCNIFQLKVVETEKLSGEMFEVSHFRFGT